MEHFRSVFPAIVYPFQLSYADHFFGIGSCFVEQIGQKLSAHKFSIFYNPLGIAFNPASVALGLDRVSTPKSYRATDLFEHQGLWHSFDHHGSFSHPDIDQTLNNIHSAQENGHAQFKKSTVLLLTLGTANVWEHLAQNHIVSNCHKLPGQVFRRRRLSVAETVEIIGSSLQSLVATRPEIVVILTVSPVRYLREGLLENTRSKASLILAAEQLSQNFAQVHYFPAYELLMDDLRDYRFYAEDLAHPSPQATAYIWDYFKKSFFAPTVIQQMQEIEKIVHAAQHRTLHPESVSHRQFLTQQLEYLTRLEDKYPEMDFSSERNTFLHQLKA